MILHVALLFYETTRVVFSPKDIYLVCQLSLIIAEGGSSTHNRLPQNIPHSVRFSYLVVLCTSFTVLMVNYSWNVRV